MSIAIDHGSNEPFNFDHAAKAVNDHFARGTGPLFTTSIDPDLLWKLYLDNMPEGFARQHHNCSCCHAFIRKFGGLVRVRADGSLESALWPVTYDGFYERSFVQMAITVGQCKLTGPFLTKEPLVWGQPTTGEWSHFSIIAQGDAVWRSPVTTPGQRMAVKRQDFITVSRALAEFKRETIDTALQIVKGEHLDRSERFVGPLEWLLALKTLPSRGKSNLLWLMISTAPDGYLHPRSGVLGQLLGWIDEGRGFPDIQRMWKGLVNPLQYQRPTAAPARANIEAAERAFAALGLAPSLERRFATLADLEETLWTPPTPTTPAPGGIFSSVKAKGEKATSESMILPAKPISLEKFSALLPQIIGLELLVPCHGQFMAFTTAVNADAPQLLKWTNPVAWYVYPNGSPASRWGLTGGKWTQVTAIATLPTMWGQSQPHLGEGILLALEGCSDSRTQGGSFPERFASKSTGNAIFPEAVRGDLHPYRDVIEAYSRQATLARPDGPLAQGYDLRRGHEGKPTLRVKMAGALTQTYTIDRWE